MKDKKYPFQEARDCPVCQVEFRPGDPVIQPECNDLHVYHKGCFRDLLLLERIQKKCVICRAELDETRYVRD